MPKFSQDNRPLQLTTPLGKDLLLITGLRGAESLDNLYTYTLDCVAELDSNIIFDKILGSAISVSLQLPDKKARFFSGICSRISQLGSGPDFTRFQLEMVPTVWLLTKNAQSRIFQHITVPDILKKVFTGFQIDLKIVGTFHPRDFCVQYREFDFDFASRLMEEEGIYYYFRQVDNREVMVLSNAPSGHLPLAPETVIFKNPLQGPGLTQDTIESLVKSQEVISGKFVLFDHCFEHPHKHLEAEKKTERTIKVGGVSAKLNQPVSASLENFDYPGAYAQRFDGVDKGGGERAGDLTKIFEDNKRTVEIRAQEEMVQAINVEGASNCRHFCSGHKMTIKSLDTDISTKPFKADGDYVLTQVSHTIETDLNFRGGAGTDGFRYKNRFSCIPADISYRPPQLTGKPVIYGTQTAVVVGPPGEEIFTDKYGRVKVQFHWDRDGKNNADSSCWVRVGSTWAGRGWGMLHIPRVGQEVIVDFLEGDPDQPIIIGSVYNADQMPHYKLPDEKTKSYLKSNSTPDGQGFNEIRLEDKKNTEQIFIHAQRNMDTRVLNERMDLTVNNQHLIVGHVKDGEHKGDYRMQVHRDHHIIIDQHQQEQIGGNFHLLIGHGDTGPGNMHVVVEGDQKVLLEKNHHLHVKEDHKVLVDKNLHQHVKMDHFTKIDQEQMIVVGGGILEKVGNSKVVNTGKNILQNAGGDMFLGSGAETYIKAGKTLIIEAGVQISLKVGGNFVDIGAAGVSINGTMVNINSGGAAGSSSLSKGADPDIAEDAEDAEQAKPMQPTVADDSKTGKKSN